MEMRLLRILRVHAARLLGRLARRRGPATILPEVGGLYCRRRLGGLVETARVLGIIEEPTGIVHIRIEIGSSGPEYGRALRSHRLLSATAFATYYKEKIGQRPGGDYALAAE
jgi:hypothetical protein